jgi:hypothetical protein
LKDFAGLWERPEDIDRLPEVGEKSLLARCLTYNEVWTNYQFDSEFKKCIFPGVLDPDDEIGVRAYNTDSYKKFPLLFDNINLLLHGSPPDHPKSTLEKLDELDESHMSEITEVKISISRNIKGYNLFQKVPMDKFPESTESVIFELNHQDHLKVTATGQ